MKSVMDASKQWFKPNLTREQGNMTSHLLYGIIKLFV